VKRKNVKEKNDAIKRKKENSEWAWMQRRNEEHNNRLLYDDSRRPKKKQKRNDEVNIIYATDPRLRAYSQ
jgi:hypothetical protein